MTQTVASPCVGAVLFTDLVGFTEFTDAVGDERAVRVLDAQSNFAASATADSPDGRLVKELGDGLMLWFGTAGSAIEAALDLMESVELARRDGAFPLAIRMGIHHGEVIERGSDVVGQTVNIAARISDLARPGELLVSDETIERADPGRLAQLLQVPIGPVRVKGVSEAVWLQRVSR